MKQIRNKQFGLTLIELLVVGTIIMIVTVVSLPMVKPMLESQQTRSAAELVSTYLNRAKNRAKITGRPCGVRFEVWNGTIYGPSLPLPPHHGGASLIMRQVDVPPAYTGFTGNETVAVASRILTINNDPYLQNKLPSQTQAKIQFAGKGPYYHVFLNTLNSTLDIQQQLTCADPTFSGVSFKVLFDPKPTLVPPMALPQGAVVDLEYSGVGTNGDDFNGVASVTIMFSPNGEVDTVNGGAPTGPIHLLIGRWEQITAVRDTTDPTALNNAADGRNFWVTVNPQSGLISTAEVNPVNTGSLTPFIQQSRQFATQAKRNIGGY